MPDSRTYESYLFEKGCDMSGLSIKQESEGYSSIGEFLGDFLSIFLAPVSVAGCCVA